MVHSANWFYVPDSKMNIWNLKKYIEKRQSPSPYAPDFSISISPEQLSQSFAIVGDTGILTRNAQSSKYNGFYDFLV